MPYGGASTGRDGKSAYQIACESGFTGNENEWSSLSVTLSGLIYLSPFGIIPPGSRLLVSDGGRLNRAAYSGLYGNIGLTFTPDDDGVTFCTPDLRGRLLRFSALGKVEDTERLLRLARPDGTAGDAVGTVLDRQFIITNVNPGGGVTLGNLNDIGLVGLIKY